MKNLNKKTWFGKMIYTAVFGVFALLGSTVYPNSITLGNVSQSPSGGGSNWTYSYSFANSFLENGDFFTINDFGLASLVTAPTFPGASWSFSQSLTGVNAAAVTDSASILNATFTWNGGNFDLGSGVSGPFNFTLHSASGVAGVVVAYSTLDQSSSSGALLIQSSLAVCWPQLFLMGAQPLFLLVLGWRVLKFCAESSQIFHDADEILRCF